MNSRNGGEKVETNKRLSKRLKNILEMIPTSCNFLVDVGCDHGHLADVFLKQNENNRALLIDLRKHPLERAKQNLLVKSRHDPEKLRFSLSSGLIDWEDSSEFEINSAQNPKENLSVTAETINTCIVVAGLGAKEIINIFAEKIDQIRSTNSTYNNDVYCIIQAMRNQENVRLFLRENGFPLLKQSIVEDKGFVYSVDLYKINFSKFTAYPVMKHTNSIVDFLGEQLLSFLKGDTNLTSLICENEELDPEQKYLLRQIRIATKETKGLPRALIEDRRLLIQNMQKYLYSENFVEEMELQI